MRVVVDQCCCSGGYIHTQYRRTCDFLPIGKHSVQKEYKLYELQCELAYLAMRGGRSGSSVRNKMQQILELDHCRAILLEGFTPIEVWLKKAKVACEKAMAKLSRLDDGEEE